MSERMLRAEQAKEEGTFGKKGWLILTTERVVFASKNELGKGERWSVPLEQVDSAAAKKPFRAATDILEILYLDNKRKRQRKVFERTSIASLALLGGAGRLESNALRSMEQAIIDAREALHRTEPAVPIAPPPAMPDLERLVDLHDRGALTDEEFAAAKRQLLGL